MKPILRIRRPDHASPRLSVRLGLFAVRGDGALAVVAAALVALAFAGVALLR